MFVCLLVCLQAYDLKEFHPSYCVLRNTSFSMNGLQQLRAVLHILYSDSQPLPPLCHPPDNKVSRLSHYTIENYKQDVMMKSILLPDKSVVITPAKLPPSAAKILSKLSVSNGHNKNNLNPGKEAISKDEDPNIDSTLTAVTTLQQVSPSALQFSSKIVEAVLDKPECIHSSTPLQKEADSPVVTSDPKEEMGETPSRKSIDKCKRPQQVKIY